MKLSDAAQAKMDDAIRRQRPVSGYDAETGIMYGYAVYDPWRYLPHAVLGLVVLAAFVAWLVLK